MSTISQFYSEGKLLNEMKCVFKDEDTTVTFHTVLEKARNFSNLSIEDRTNVLADIVIFKGELDSMRVKVEAVLRKLDAIEYKSCFDEIKQKGLRYTEELLKSMRDAKDLENTNPKYGLAMEQFRCCSKWVSILTDLYFVLNSTNKILSNNV